MSDTTLALLITVLALLALAAWVPLLQASQTFIVRLTEDNPTVPEEATADTQKAA